MNNTKVISGIKNTFRTTVLPFKANVIVQLWLFLLFVFTSPVAAHRTLVDLTDYEKNYLQQLGPVTMCIDPAWRPFEYLDENGNYSGIAADLIQLISERTGIEFKLIPTANWSESLEKSQKGECMILTFLHQSEERKKWLLFTNTYFSDYNVLITREEHTDIDDITELKGHTLALPSETSSEERIRKDFPGIKIQIYDTEEEAFEAVNDRRADMTMRSLIMSAHMIKTEGWFNLKIAGRLPDYKINFKIGVSKEHPHLRDILNKAIVTLDEHDIQNAINNHVKITVVDKTDYSRMIQIAVILAALISIGFLWNHQLRHLNQRLKLSQTELIKLSEQQENEIAQRKQVELKLRSSEQQLTNLISNLPGFVYRCLDDQYYTMLLISEGCTSVTGYLPSDFINNKNIPFSELILPEEIPAIQQKWITAMQFHSHFEHEYRIRHADGSIRWIWERGYVVIDDASSQKMMEGFITDITARKIAEAELFERENMLHALNAQKDKFFSIIAHDLRSPFTAIVGFSELLADRLSAKEYEGMEEYVDMILKSSKKTLDLLMNLLEWARSQTGRMSFNPEYFELNEVIDDTTFVLRNMAGQKSLTFVKELPANIVVYADRQMLDTIVRNLVSNAIKFTPANGTVTIRAIRTEHATQLQVIDTGVGIPKHRIERLFRIDSSESTLGTNEEEGTGLGLILCKEFADKHQGSLEVESEPGKGSVFTLTLLLRM